MSNRQKPDFSGYATRFNIKCSDGRVIKPEAFKHMDGKRVTLMWQHSHENPEHILGYADLEHRDDGTYAYAYFNTTTLGQNVKAQVLHGDITALSIFAKNLKQRGNDVEHGDIKEVSLVMAGANPGAFIDNVDLRHSDSEDAMVGSAVIYTGENFTLSHSDSEGDSVADPLEHADGAGKTVQQVIDSMSEEQQNVLYSLLASKASGAIAHSDDEPAEPAKPVPATETTDATKDGEPIVEPVVVGATPVVPDAEDPEGANAAGSPITPTPADNVQHSDQEGLDMTRNVWDGANTAVESKPTLSHSDVQAIMQKAAKNRMKVSEVFEDYVLAHADFTNFLSHGDASAVAGVDYGIADIEYLFPDARTITNQPELIARQAEWVPRVLGATKHAPFARIKSITADITAPEARAKGYIKGTEKVDEVVKLLKRTTSPTTVYKKQKLDRDDIIDITDLDVVAWLKWEIKFMLDEEVARAILIGDGRESSNPDKIKDPEGAADGIGIRSIAKDNDLYAIKIDIDSNIEPDALINEITRARTQYRGSGSPTLYTTDKILTDLLLLPDRIGRRLYATETELASAMRVKEIVSVEVMEESDDVFGIVVNLGDYTIGTNKGGELTFFSDFDIDFNQEKYLMETRLSGALTKPKSALVLRRLSGVRVVPTTPSFNGETNTITVPTVTGVQYLVDDDVVTGNVVITKNTTITARAASGFYIAPNTGRDWTYAFSPTV